MDFVGGMVERPRDASASFDFVVGRQWVGLMNDAVGPDWLNEALKSSYLVSCSDFDGGKGMFEKKDS